MGTSEAGPSKGKEIPPDTAKFPYLASLNAAQLQAVTANPSTPLQILAGPGSGKTRVLTSRVAYLVQHHGYKPHQITAVTFTNKAAAEMKKRLRVLLGDQAADALVLGTFHATCVKYLRRYGQMIALPNNFSISDADDCKKIMSRLLKAKADVLEESRMSLKEGAVLSEISKAKAKEESPDGMAIRAAQDPSTSTNTLAIIAELYMEYEEALRESNSLDFDDLLVYGLKLFRTAPRILESCFHILVDEFQDTNTTQYELMKCFAKAHGGVSVVGDPDQSIYGWRSAEVENLNKMTSDFPGVQAIYLEENYRSTGSILAAAHSVVSQDRDRIQKNLYTSHPNSTPVCLKVFSTPVIEASFIATEIKRLIAYSGGVLKYDDFAILLRYNALSRVIESALQKDSIPNRIVGGHKFFERMEIKDLLAYLQLLENPNFTPAFVRVVNVPKRAIGDKSVADLLAAAKAQKVSPMELCELICDGGALPVGIKPAIKNKLASFVGIIRRLRRSAVKGTPVADLIRLIIEKTGYEEYLRTSQPDFDSRWENVQELISFSVTIAEEQARQADSFNEDPDNAGFIPASSAAMEALVMKNEKAMKKKEDEKPEKPLHPMFRNRAGSDASSTSRSRSTSIQPERKRGKPARKEGRIKEEPIEVVTSDEEEKKTVVARQRPKAPIHRESDLTPLSEEEPMFDIPKEEDKDNPAEMTPLAFFLQTSMLSTDTDADQAEKIPQPKVTITTVHAAKGLEWPVVFIPAVEQGTYPSYRCTETHEIAEERRLLYVAMTRAQTLLTMSYCQFRMMGGEENDKVPSEFVVYSQKANASMYDDGLPDIDEGVRKNIATMLERPIPDEVATKDMIMKHVRSAPPVSMWDKPEPRDNQFNRFARREVTKAARAAEYWASDLDEYALPGSVPGGSAATNGFTSAKGLHTHHRDKDRMSQPNNIPREAKPPPVILKSRNHEFPAPPQFTFNTPRVPQPEAGLGMFTDSSNSSLAMMKNLGLPGGTETSNGIGNGSSPLASPNLSNSGFSPQIPGVSTFQSAAKDSLSMLKNLGPPEAVSVQQPVQLAKGTKRLGMGRPAPWGARKARAE